MSEILSLKNYSWWQTSVTHTKWERLMIQTIIFNLVTKSLDSSTILTFLLWQMFISTLFLLLDQIILKRLMLNKIGSIFSQLGHFSFIDHFSLFLRHFFNWFGNHLSTSISYLTIVLLLLNFFNNVTS